MLFFSKTIVRTHSQNGRLQLIIPNCFLNVHNGPTKREKIFREFKMLYLYDFLQCNKQIIIKRF